METIIVEASEKEVAISQNLGRMSRQLAIGASLRLGFSVQVCVLVFYSRDGGGTTTMWRASTEDQPSWAKSFRTFIEQMSGQKDEQGGVINNQPGCGERFLAVSQVVTPMAVALGREVVRVCGESQSLLLAVQGSERGNKEVWSAFATNIAEGSDEIACAMLRDVIDLMESPINKTNTPGLGNMH